MFSFGSAEKELEEKNLKKNKFCLQSTLTGDV